MFAPGELRPVYPGEILDIYVVEMPITRPYFKDGVAQRFEGSGWVYNGNDRFVVEPRQWSELHKRVERTERGVLFTDIGIRSLSDDVVIEAPVMTTLNPFEVKIWRRWSYYSPPLARGGDGSPITLANFGQVFLEGSSRDQTYCFYRIHN